MRAATAGEGIQRLSLSKQHHALTELSAWLAAVVEQQDLPANAAFRLKLVLTEAVTNIMDHDGDPMGEGRIDLTCQVDAETVRIVITDDGAPFDPTARAEVILPTSLDTAQPGGLGIHLMRRYTSAMEYRRQDGRNILSLTLPLATEPSTP
jgi:anti-sigma regulatory factor (Ser/Thr protein kinase)